MDIIDKLYKEKICGMSPYYLKDKLEKFQYTVSGMILLVQNEKNKMKNINCISNIYCHPGTNKKYKSNAVNNPCFNVKNVFEVSGYGYNCADCHKQMLNKLLNNEANLLHKKS